MTMRIDIEQSERGWELTYSYNNGPFCMGSEEESVAYKTKGFIYITCTLIHKPFPIAHNILDLRGETCRIGL